MASTQTRIDVDSARDLYEAFNRQDVETVLGFMADDIEWTEPEGFLFGGTHRGPDAVLENVFEPSMRRFESFVVEPDRFINGGETIVVLGTFHVVSRDGERIDSPFAHVWDTAGGKAVRMTNYTDTALWQ